ncbi:hypothetical protein DFH07DRAFT_764579 [Mycena maculata]|uniref:CxC2-like cysteine cluster KDZ transposase-associated domain-containing protein n=1 Tax=Mycena maculata TaxID=230809 RepID=A0AAD7P0B4_9AGAR|nr:hypothetical protein DFH07DRAFT_764579 [Mycena maculata]
MVCPFKWAVLHDFVLYDLSGIHEINVDFCGCMRQVRAREGGGPDGEDVWRDIEGDFAWEDVAVEDVRVAPQRIQLLRTCWWPGTVRAPNTCTMFALCQLFQIINCLGKLSAYDFLWGLEQCTNHDGLNKPPDRQKPFMHIMWQWQEVKHMKRGKRGHAAGGVAATEQGELALMCRTCPQPGWNLPPDWENIDPFFRYIYWLFLTQDANFRLSNQNVSMEIADPILGDGLGYFCKCEGEDGYKVHIVKHVNEEEVSIRSKFLGSDGRDAGDDAVVLGGNGSMVESPKFPPAGAQEEVSCSILLSLDVGSQDDSRGGGGTELVFFERGCGVSKADGPGGEASDAGGRFWIPQLRLSASNARRHVLTGKITDRVLPKRLAVSIKEGTKHKLTFDTFTAELEEQRPEEWEAKQQTDTEDSPFKFLEEVTMLRKIQLQIGMEEFLCTDDGVEVEQEHTPGLFITEGLEIEEVQQRLEVDVRALKDPLTAQKLGFMKRRMSLLKRIHRFHAAQQIYMPALRMLLSDLQRQVFDGNGEQVPEATQLIMPSDIEDERLRGKACAKGLPEIEVQMREGEAQEVLDGVRQGLRTRTLTNRFKTQNWMDQGILRQINIRIHAAKLRYHYAWAALLALQGHSAWEDWLRVLGEDDEEKAQNAHWAELGGAVIKGGVARAAALAGGEGAHTLSWIWYTIGVTENGNESQLHEALPGMEMRRTIAFGYTAAEKWDVLARDKLPGVPRELTEGRHAYATEHAQTERDTYAMLERKWAGILLKADVFLDGNAALDTEAVVMVELEMGDELDPEEQARLEGEEEA